MIRLKEMTCKGFYLLKGKAAANSLIFEDKSETDKFRKMVHSYLSPYFVVKEYCFKPDGWMLIVKIRDKRTILSRYLKKRKNSKSKKDPLTKVWQILSEQVRLWLSHYARWANIKRGREGTLVKNVYERYLFESTEEALSKINEMRNNEVDLSQPHPRFRGNLENFDNDNLIELNPWSISSKMAQLGQILRQIIGIRLLYIWVPTDVVLQKLIKTTIENHFPNYFNKNTSMSS